MRLKQPAPTFAKMLKKRRSASEMQRLLGLDLQDAGYLHWDQLEHRRFPEGVKSREDWWFALKMRRVGKPIELRGTDGLQFSFALPDPITEQLHKVDLMTGGAIGLPEQVTNPDTREQYYVSSLIEEAITSSQLEGATTTRRIAKDMLRSGRQPVDRSQQMILNNFLTMKRIGELRNEPLSTQLLFDIHRLVTDDTQGDPSAIGRFRRDSGDEREIAIYGPRDELPVHIPPPARELSERAERMCAFANGTDRNDFLHPVLRSIILHFWLAYDHPFCDGNGRTARALFYWSMLRHEYWLFEFVSISKIIARRRGGYDKAFVYTETDENDLTYFLLYHLEVIEAAIEEMRKYVTNKIRALRDLERNLDLSHSTMNHRQRQFIGNALRARGARYTVRGHQASHGVAYQTARTDLLDLVERGLLSVKKVKNTMIFTPRPNLEKLLNGDGE